MSFKTHTDFALKVKGLSDYLMGDAPLVKFHYMWDALLKKKKPELVVVEKPKVVVDKNSEEQFKDIDVSVLLVFLGNFMKVFTTSGFCYQL